jgi:hypothetical protein
MLAMVIIIGSFTLIGVAFLFINGSDQQFARVKDILLFVNPILGIVIGYYFNKVTSDARANTAEKAAQTAVETAQNATQIRDDAVDRAKVAENTADEMRSTLEEVTQKAGDMIDQAAAVPAPAGAAGTLSFGDLEGSQGGVPNEGLLVSRLELQNALKRANRVLGKQAR